MNQCHFLLFHICHEYISGGFVHHIFSGESRDRGGPVLTLDPVKTSSDKEKQGVLALLGNLVSLTLNVRPGGGR